MTNQWRRLILGCGFVWLAACGDAGADEAPAVSVRDSAGIEIVENGEPPAAATDTLAAPAAAIGVLEGAPEYQLYGARAALRMRDGRIAVANSGTKELRFYAPDGSFVGASGREGEGPGEFREMASLFRLTGDSLLVYDWRTRRLSLMDPQGGFVRSVGMPMPERRFPFPIGVLDDERVVVRLGRMFGRGAPPADGLVPDTVQLALFDWRSDSAALGEPFARLPGGDMYLASGGSARNRWISMMSVLLAPSASTEVRGSLVYHTLGDRYEIQVLGADGRLRRVIRRGHTPVPITSAMHEQAVERNLENIEDENQKKRQRTMIQGMPVPEVLPAIQRLTVDRAGRVWSQRYSAWEDEPGTWDVFDERGGWIAAVQMPARFRPTDIGRDWVLGIARDELDVEQVRLYDLDLRPAPELAAR